MYKQHAIALCLYQSGEINKDKIERIVGNAIYNNNNKGR